MKFILANLLLLSTFGFSQTTEYEDFKLQDQEIIYQAVFQDESVTYAKLEEQYKKNKQFSSIKVSANEMTFNVKDLTVDYLKFQFSQVQTPLILQTGKFSGQVSVAIRDGRYRVTFNKIMVTGEIGYKSIKEKEPLTGLCSKSNGTQLSQDWMKPNTLGLLGKAFADNFELKATDDDW
ncbi:MAG: hypothetical protein KDC93_00860 [Cyclobacteriaceae bacterium]|jgi:hypothetical protein|nr:hypothetical protein [Cyclobacteriaceae bacterium]